MINREIDASVVKVINNETKGLTEMSLDSAIELAEETGEDVVLISKQDDIPIVRIIDYNKFLYEKQKKEKENKKKSRLNAQALKEIQIGDATADHDLAIKAKNADRILSNGDKVMFVIKYKGRSVRFIEDGPSKLQHLVSMVTSEYKIDKTPKIEGNKVSMVISPIKK